MRMSQNGIRLLTQWEGCELKPYKDSADLWTIGIGHLIKNNELGSGTIRIGSESVEWKNGITYEQALDLLAQDLQIFEVAVDRAVNVPLKQHQFDALTSFCFNVGARNFRNSTLLKKLNLGLYDNIPAQLMRWVYAGGKKVAGLTNRRTNEAKLWRGEI